MVSHPELGSDPPIGSDRESGCDMAHSRPSIFIIFLLMQHVSQEYML